MVNPGEYTLFLILLLSIHLNDITKCQDISVLNITKTSADDIEGKIVGGDPVSIESFPFQVQIFNFGSMCSGSIINSWTVLTAAHCFDLNKNIHEMRVQAESRYVYDFNAKIYDVKTFVIHKKYNSTAQFVNDIALLFVDGPIQLGTMAQKAILVNNDAWMSPEQTNFTVTGWGWTQVLFSNNSCTFCVVFVTDVDVASGWSLQLYYSCEGIFPALYHGKCSEELFDLIPFTPEPRVLSYGVTASWCLLYPGPNQEYGGPISDLGLMMTHLKFVPSGECSRLHNLKISDDMFCLYGDGTRDTCKGDSGGGVLWSGMIVGVTSHGDGCAKKHKPSVYTNVWHFRKWIERNMYRFFDMMCRQRIKKYFL